MSLGVVATAVVLSGLGWAVGAVDARRASATDTSGFEQITAYDSKIEVRPDGDLAVTETIRYDFGFVPRHGIYRKIPNRYTYNDRYDRIVRIHDITVAASAGTPTDTAVTDEDNDLQVKIGSSDQTIDGVHTYRIRYLVTGAINRFTDHDELFWNAVGGEWTVTVHDATASAATPSPITKVACYAGYEHSTLPCDHANHFEKVAAFSQSTVYPTQSFTIVVGFERGVIPAAATEPILEERWSLARAFSITPLSIGLAAGAVLLVMIFGLILAKRARDYRYVGSAVDAAYGNDGGPQESVPAFDREQITVEFVPIDGLRPGQVGTIIDEEASVLDVSATIVDLAVRGFIRIEELKAPGRWRAGDWKLVRLTRATDGLLEYERTLLAGLFGRDDEVDLSDLKTKFSTKMSNIRDALMKDAIEREWFVGHPNRQRAGWLGLGIVLLLLSIGLEILLVVFTHLAIVGIPLFIGAVLLIAFAHTMPRRTAKGHAVALHVLGFKRFIDESEQRRAEFAEKTNLFTEYLPYAIVFGAVDKWADAFEGLAIEPTTWYVGQDQFSVVALTRGINSFTVTSSGTLSASPPSTSASGGSSGFSGGSSGGGFGGGGGGSW